MAKHFELKYELVVRYDSGREIVLNSFTMSDAETKANEWALKGGVRRVDIFRVERFYSRKFFATERR